MVADGFTRSSRHDGVTEGGEDINGAFIVLAPIITIF